MTSFLLFCVTLTCMSAKDPESRLSGVSGMFTRGSGFCTDSEDRHLCAASIVHVGSSSHHCMRRPHAAWCVPAGATGASAGLVRRVSRCERPPHRKRVTPGLKIPSVPATSPHIQASCVPRAQRKKRHLSAPARGTGCPAGLAYRKGVPHRPGAFPGGGCLLDCPFLWSLTNILHSLSSMRNAAATDRRQVESIAEFITTFHYYRFLFN